MMRPHAVILIAVVMAVGAVAFADDLSYVSDEDIAAELVARSADVERTVERLRSLRSDREQAVARLERARMESLEAERRLAENAGLLYRLSHHGKAVRYLLASGSPMAFMKRIHNLRRLVLKGMIDRRDCGVRLAQTEADLEGIELEISSAGEMLRRLEGAVGDLRAERDRREQAVAAAVFR